MHSDVAPLSLREHGHDEIQQYLSASRSYPQTSRKAATPHWSGVKSADQTTTDGRRIDLSS
jgi:hypothetical protein